MVAALDEPDSPSASAITTNGSTAAATRTACGGPDPTRGADHRRRRHLRRDRLHPPLPASEDPPRGARRADQRGRNAPRPAGRAGLRRPLLGFAPACRSGPSWRRCRSGSRPRSAGRSTRAARPSRGSPSPPSRRRVGGRGSTAGGGRASHRRVRRDRRGVRDPGGVGGRARFGGAAGRPRPGRAGLGETPGRSPRRARPRPWPAPPWPPALTTPTPSAGVPGGQAAADGGAAADAATECHGPNPSPPRAAAEPDRARPPPAAVSRPPTRHRAASCRCSPGCRSSVSITCRRSAGSATRVEHPALEQRREHDLGLGADHAGGVADALERLLEVLGVGGAQVEDRARRAGDRVGRLDLGVLADRLADLVARHPPLAEELDEGVGVPADRRGIDVRRVAADDPVALEPVDAALDRRRRERDAAADVLERPPRVLPKQRNDSMVYFIHSGDPTRDRTQRIGA